jgi:hypothetical protein
MRLAAERAGLLAFTGQWALDLQEETGGMSVIALPPSRETAAAESAPLLHWLIFTGASAFAAVLLCNMA